MVTFIRGHCTFNVGKYLEHLRMTNLDDDGLMDSSHSFLLRYIKIMLQKSLTTNNHDPDSRGGNKW